MITKVTHINKEYVRCINADGITKLTVGKCYELIRWGVAVDTVDIVIDGKNEFGFFGTRFQRLPNTKSALNIKD